MPLTCLSQDVQFSNRLETLRWSRHSSYISNSGQNSQNFRNRKSISGSISERLTLNPIHEDIVVLFKWGGFHLIRWIRRIGQNHPCMNQDRFAASHKHKKHSSVTVREADSYASDLGSILGQVYQIFCKFILWNSSILTRITTKTRVWNHVVTIA